MLDSMIVNQHVDDTAFLHAMRMTLARAPHARLKDLGRFDDRLAAHIDGLLVSGEKAWKSCTAALAASTASTLFTAAVLAIEDRAKDRLNQLYALTEAVPDTQSGLVSAFGWVEQRQLRGTVVSLLASSNAYLRLLGIKVCAIHRVDAGQIRDAITEASNFSLCATALRTVGELGRRDLLPQCIRMLDAEDSACRFWAAWSAVLLGNRSAGLKCLMDMSEIPEPLRLRAFRLLMQTMDQHDAHAWLSNCAKTPENLRFLIEGAGIVGDPSYLPWLIQQMTNPKTARLAGEAFSLITGLDLVNSDMERKPPDGGDAGPTDDPEDPNVETDPDDGLPWPDPNRISRWLEVNGSRFESGTRYFLGAGVTRENCIMALKDGYQRQRILAAHYLCLLEPGTVLFEWRAPAYRQQRLLAAMH